MRLVHRFTLCLALALCFVQTAIANVSYSFTGPPSAPACGGFPQPVYVKCVQTGTTVATGNDGVHNWGPVGMSLTAGPNYQFCMVDLNFQNIGNCTCGTQPGLGTTGGTFTFGTNGLATGTTNIPYYTFHVPGWTNTSGSYADFGYRVTDGNGNSFDPGWTVSIPPGGTVSALDFTNNTTGGTPCWGDMRADSTMTLSCGTMTTNYYNPSTPVTPQPPTPPTTVTNAPVVGTGNGDTNSVQKTDIILLANTIAGGQGATTKAVDYGTSVSSNLLAGTTNLLGRINSGIAGLGTNGTGGSGGSNVWVQNFPTNYANGIVETNTTAIVSNLNDLSFWARMSSNLYNGVYGTNWSTNLLAAWTNQYTRSLSNLFGPPAPAPGTISGSTLGEVASNFTSVATGPFNGTGSGTYAGAISNDMASAAGNTIGTTAAGSFGVLDLGTGTLDLKKIFNGSGLESPFSAYTPGTGWSNVVNVYWSGFTFRTALRLFLVWSICIGMIIEYAKMIKQEMIEVLKIPAAPVTPLLGTGALSTAPIRIGLTILIASTLAFIPSVVVTAAATVFTLIGHGGSGAIPFLTSNSGLTMIQATNAFDIIFGLLNAWLPLTEGFIFALNFVVASMGLGTVVTSMGIWMKGAGA